MLLLSSRISNCEREPRAVFCVKSWLRPARGGRVCVSVTAQIIRFGLSRPARAGQFRLSLRLAALQLRSLVRPRFTTS